MASSRFTLRGLIAFTAAIGVACGLAAAGDTSTTKGILLLGLAARIFAVVVIGGVIGIWARSTSRVVASATIGVLFADAVWLAFLFSITTIASKDTADVVTNPILFFAMLASPAAAIRDRMRALKVGLSLSILVPTMLAAVIVIIIARAPVAPSSDGPGMAQALTVSIAAISIFTGMVATITARAMVEVGSHWANRWHTKRRNRRVTQAMERTSE